MLYELRIKATSPVAVSYLLQQKVNNRALTRPD